MQELDVCVGYDDFRGRPTTMVRNKGDAVWTFPGITWTEMNDPVGEAGVSDGTFAEASELWAPGDESTAYLDPSGAWTLARDVSDVRWEMDLGLTYTWAAVELMNHQLTVHGEDMTPWRFQDAGDMLEVMAVCTKAFYDYTQSVPDLPSMEALEVLTAGFQTLRQDPCAAGAREMTLQSPYAEGRSVLDALEAVEEFQFQKQAEIVGAYRSAALREIDWTVCRAEQPTC